MLISRKTLDTLVDISTVSNDELSHQLSCYGGLEVESIEYLVEQHNYIVGFVESCEKHPDADKLNVCRVNIGTEVLQIVCGAPNVAAGKYVVVALVGTVLPNGMEIGARVVRGVESAGMLCALQEIGLEDKYVDARYKDGIYLFEDSIVEVGEDALKALGFDTTVFDLSITPNRADCLSYRGVAYEVAALFDKKIDTAVFEKEREKGTFPIANYIEAVDANIDAVKAYHMIAVDNIVIKPSPVWMQSFLIASGVRPISNVVDITNYVMLYLGLPLHAFDAKKMQSKKIIVRYAEENEVMETLDGKKRVLSPEDIMIATSEKAIGIAGVMGGSSTEVDETTTTIALEAAIFDAGHIRKTATAFNLRSDASQRFEKGVDPALPQIALALAAKLLVKYADASVSTDCIAIEKTAKDKAEIHFTHQQLVHKIGVTLAPQEVIALLERLEFSAKEQNLEYTVSAPSWRLDISIFEDIAEEVARLYGFDNIPNTLPVDTSRPVFKTQLQQVIDGIHQKLQAQGIQEMLTYTLASEEKATLGSHGETLDPLTILYPLNTERTTLKTATYHSIIDVLQYHKNRLFSGVKFYEITDLYGKGKAKKVLSFGCYGELEDEHLHGITIKADYFILKGWLENSLSEVSDSFMYKTTEHPLFHPKMAADVYVAEKYIGTLGKIHPTVAKEMDISDDFYVGEIELDAILEQLIEQKNTKKVYTPVSKLPTIERDLAFVLAREIPAATLVSAIRESAGEDCKAIKVFDVYQGANIGKDEKSISIKLQFNNSKQTLTNEGIDMVVKEILKHVKLICGAIVRGAQYEA